MAYGYGLLLKDQLVGVMSNTKTSKIIAGIVLLCLLVWQLIFAIDL